MLYKAQFPESLYIPKTEESLKVYEERVYNGEKIMRRLKVAIVTLARDIEHVFPYTKARIEQLQKMFYHAEVIIVENDSKDNTKKLLKKWYHENDSIDDVICADFGYDRFYNKSTERRKIMAEQRNIYMDRLTKINGYRNRISYVIIMDSDIAGGFSYNGIANSFGFNQDWSCISGNSIIYRESNNKLEKLFYDTWARRYFGSWNETCGENGNKTVYECGEEPIPMYSNFGGLAIYKYEDIVDLRYTDEDCDHVTLNRQLIEKGKSVYLNPSMITLQTPTYISRELCYQDKNV